MGAVEAADADVDDALAEGPAVVRRDRHLAGEPAEVGRIEIDGGGRGGRPVQGDSSTRGLGAFAGRRGGGRFRAAGGVRRGRGGGAAGAARRGGGGGGAPRA